MGKKRIFLTVLLVCVFVLSGCECKHVWESATCDLPQICSKCEETSGLALGHKWVSATCTTSETCTTCGKIRGAALGHNWMEANCVQAETCSNCGEVRGEALGHMWTDANYQQPQTCSVCEMTEGEPVKAVFAEYGLETMPAETAAEYTMTVGDVPVKVSVLGCEELDPQEFYEASEGYSWMGVAIQLEAESALPMTDDGMPIYFDFADYYDMEGHYNSRETHTEEDTDQVITTFTVNYEGTDHPCYVVSEIYTDTSSSENEENEEEAIEEPWALTIVAYFHIPQGYDGVVLVYGDLTRLYTEYEGDYMNMFLDENTLFLRIS